MKGTKEREWRKKEKSTFVIFAVASKLTVIKNMNI
jgi:hypothetical protein